MFNLKHWFPQGIVLWIVTVILGIIGGGVLAALKLHQSEWASPALYGSAGFFMIMALGSLLIGVSRLPRVRTRVTTKNIETHVRAWLDDIRASVKSEPQPEAFFRLVVTLAGGASVVIGRTKAVFPQHVVIRADLVSATNVPEALRNATQDDRDKLFGTVKLELARLKVAYSGLAFPVVDPFYLSKFIPISDHLNEDVFLAGVFDVEASINAVAAIYALWLKRPSL